VRSRHAAIHGAQQFGGQAGGPAHTDEKLGGAVREFPNRDQDGKVLDDGGNGAGVAALWWEAVTKARNVKPSDKLVVDKLRPAARVDVFAPTVQIGDRGVGLVTAPQ
jgi:hypothetical protein